MCSSRSLPQLYVVGRLSDAKAEVRQAAAATLSGMLKSSPVAAAADLRSGMVAQARQLFGRQAASATADKLVQKQGCIQVSLGQLVLYTCVHLKRSWSMHPGEPGSACSTTGASSTPSFAISS